MDKFKDRQEAGLVLAKELKKYKNHPQAILLALPRGGVPVAYQIAQKLNLPLDLFIVRKLGVPGHKELAMGAIASGDVSLFNERIIKDLNISEIDLQNAITAEKEELARREVLYRGNLPEAIIENKYVILVDDGIATGATIRVAIKALRQKNPAKIILAVPVASLLTYQELKKEVDEIYCPLKPLQFYAVGLWYENFPQTEDSEVSTLIKKSSLLPLREKVPRRGG